MLKRVGHSLKKTDQHKGHKGHKESFFIKFPFATDGVVTRERGSQTVGRSLTKTDHHEGHQG